MPAVDPADVERDMRDADPVPGNLDRRLLRLKLEDLDNAAARNADPAHLAAWGIDVRTNAEEALDAIGRLIGDADQRAAEDVPVEADGGIEVADGDAGMAEGSGSHGVVSVADELRFSHSAGVWV